MAFLSFVLEGAGHRFGALCFPLTHHSAGPLGLGFEMDLVRDFGATGSTKGNSCGGALLVGAVLGILTSATARCPTAVGQRALSDELYVVPKSAAGWY